MTLVTATERRPITRPAPGRVSSPCPIIFSNDFPTSSGWRGISQPEREPGRHQCGIRFATGEAGLRFRRDARGDRPMAIASSTKPSRPGAVAIVTDSAEENPRKGVAWTLVPHGRRALARVSENFYKHPAERFAIIGITGTNGKSTTAFLIEAILAAAGRKSALIGTIEYHVAGRTIPRRIPLRRRSNSLACSTKPSPREQPMR